MMITIFVIIVYGDYDDLNCLDDIWFDGFYVHGHDNYGDDH